MKTGAGQRVFVNPTHMKQHQDVLPFLEDAVSRIIPPEHQIFSKHQVDYDQVLGLAAKVEARPGDQYIYAQRKGRPGLTRFVTNRDYEVSYSVTVVMCKDVRASKKEPTFRVLTAYIGGLAEREPDDPSVITDEEKAVTTKYWTDNVLVWGSQEIVPGTEVFTRS